MSKMAFTSVRETHGRAANSSRLLQREVKCTEGWRQSRVRGMLKGHLYAGGSLPTDRETLRVVRNSDSPCTQLSNGSVCVSPFLLPTDCRSPLYNEEISVISVDLLRSDEKLQRKSPTKSKESLQRLPSIQGKNTQFARRVKPHFSQPASICHSPKSAVRPLNSMDSSPLFSASTDDKDCGKWQGPLFEEKEEEFRRLRYPASVSPVRNAFGLDRIVRPEPPVNRDSSFDEIDRFLKRLKDDSLPDRSETRISPSPKARHRKQLSLCFPREVFGGRSVRKRRT